MINFSPPVPEDDRPAASIQSLRAQLITDPRTRAETEEPHQDAQRLAGCSNENVSLAASQPCNLTRVLRSLAR